MRSICFFLSVACSLIAQTTVPPGQLRRWGGGTLDDLRLFAVALDGVAQVRLGPGLRLEDRGGVLTLVAVPVEPTTRVLEQDANGNYVCPECTSRIYRNGIRMAPAIDYYHNGGGIIPLVPWRKDDLVLAEVPGPPIKAVGTTAGVWPPTVAGFQQIRNWTMLRNPNSTGTSIRLEQTPMPRDIADIWQGHAAKPQYDEYRVALVKTQSFPILITCADGRCDDSWPLWFKSGEW